MAAALLGVWALWTVWRQWGLFAPDLSSLYLAGWFWQQGQPGLIYDAPAAFFGGQAPSWAAAMAELAPGQHESFPFIYAPIWAVLVAPLTRVLDLQGFINLVTLLQVPLLAGSVALAGRLARPGFLSPLIWALIGILLLELSFQGHSALMQNQPQITAGFLVLLAFDRLSRGNQTQAGMILALAAALKLAPLAFAVIFLANRQLRAFATFAGAGLALGLASLALGGLALHGEFLGLMADMRGATVLSPVNPSLLAVLMAAASLLGLAAPLDLAANSVVMAPVPGWLATGLLMLGAGLVLVLARRLQAQEPLRRQAILLFAIAIIIP
ncbi:MAG: glycosyltransferase 87 family protein, partial [Paracoccaceae bacterium]